MLLPQRRASTDASIPYGGHRRAVVVASFSVVGVMALLSAMRTVEVSHVEVPSDVAASREVTVPTTTTTTRAVDQSVALVTSALAARPFTVVSTAATPEEAISRKKIEDPNDAFLVASLVGAPRVVFAPLWKLADDGGAAERLAVAKSDELLRRALNEPDLSPAQREGLQREAVVSRAIGMEVAYVLDGPSDQAPDAASVAATGHKGFDKSSVVFAVMTGRSSHGDRTRGLQELLRSRRVLWFSDEGHADLKPVVPRSTFEADVCKRNLAYDTQFKGCRYQRHFYWILEVIQICAAAAHWTNFTDGRAATAKTPLPRDAGANETGWDGVVGAMASARWLIKVADDTLLIVEHLEWFLATIEAAQRVDPVTEAIVIGKMEKRSGYWFFSGGHPTIFSREALRVWGTPGSGDGYRCESTVIDTAPAKLKKFWWWADDVLISHCIAAAGPARYTVVDLVGAISVEHFRQAPLPTKLYDPVTYVSHDASQVRTKAPPAAGGKKRRGGGLETKRRNVTALPISYHAYPYISPRQMFSLWHHLHDHPVASTSP